MTRPNSAGAVRIGIVGPPAVTHRMVEVGHSLVVAEATPMSLVGTQYQKLSQIADRVRGVVADVDVVLFAGPLPYDIAKEAGVLTRPATYVELSGSSLYGAMLRAMRGGRIDPERVSIDSLSVAAIAEAYEQCELDDARVRARPYDGPDSASGFADFHRALYERGRTTGALTTVDAVARELTRAKVPVVRVQATGSALRAALRAAAVLGAGSVLEGAQLVIGLVELPDVRKLSSGPGGWAALELRLDALRALRADTDRLSISVLPRDDRTFVLVATLASVTDASGQFVVSSFVNRVRRATGVTPYVGFGMGATATSAEANAEHALDDARAGGADRVYVRLRDGSTLALSDGDAADTTDDVVDSKHLETVAALRAGIAEPESDAQLVDAELAARLLGISARTARRVLQELVRDGLAWPVPPASVTTPGRPRQTYRLVATRP
ncbi:MAG TPA: hypothetical protein VHV49_18725 [Pseudonocardiaceae bacterium]|jgi:hypothetical protein|nr:hypothetical protein [Pseudonocardiaceae bacterium]